MAYQYVTNKTSYLYENANDGKWSMVLIYGDEVDATGTEVNERIPVKYRDRQGYIKKDHLGSSRALEVYYIDVGQGDSTFIVTPDRKNILIDGGQTGAHWDSSPGNTDWTNRNQPLILIYWC